MTEYIVLDIGDFLFFFSPLDFAKLFSHLGKVASGSANPAWNVVSQQGFHFQNTVIFFFFAEKKYEEIFSKKTIRTPEPSCLKLLTLLVNVSLKFQTLISEIGHYFLLKKCEKLLHCKSLSHFFNKNFQCIWL